MSDIKYGERPLYSPTGNIYLLGDVHNEADKLIDILDKVESLIAPEDHVVFLGDLVNRGLQAALTIGVLVDFAKKYPTQVFFVRGNHDWMLQRYLVTGVSHFMEFLCVSLDDYKHAWSLPNTDPDVIAQALTDRGFREITSRMIPYYETTSIIATHAPLDLTTLLMNGGDDYAELYKNRLNDASFNFLLERIDNDIMWQFTDENLDIPFLDKFRVCGHQPGHYKHPRLYKNRAFIDTGAGKGKRPITCLVWPSKSYYQSKC